MSASYRFLSSATPHLQWVTAYFLNSSHYRFLFRQLVLMMLCGAEIASATTFSETGFSGTLNRLFTSDTVVEQKFLPVEQAFQLNIDRSETTLTLRWSIKPGHYLYRSRFSVWLIDHNDRYPLEPHTIPTGMRIHDEFLGDVEILKDQVTLVYTLPPSSLPAFSADIHNRDLTLQVGFQGCAEAGFCYPPHQQQLTLPKQTLP